MKQTVNDAKLDKDGIHEVLMVGESTRILKMLQDFFNGKQMNTSKNPDRTVAYGAASLTFTLVSDKLRKVQKLLLIESPPPSQDDKDPLLSAASTSGLFRVGDSVKDHGDATW